MCWQMDAQTPPNVRLERTAEQLPLPSTWCHSCQVPPRLLKGREASQCSSLTATTIGSVCTRSTTPSNDNDRCRTRHPFHTAPPLSDMLRLRLHRAISPRQWLQQLPQLRHVVTDLVVSVDQRPLRGCGGRRRRGRRGGTRGRVTTDWEKWASRRRNVAEVARHVLRRRPEKHPGSTCRRCRSGREHRWRRQD